MKNLPREARGAFTILVTFFMGLAGLSFNVIGGPIFDAFGPAAPFTLISVFDMAFFAFAILLGITGHLTTTEKDSVRKQGRIHKPSTLDGATEETGQEAR